LNTFFSRLRAIVADGGTRGGTREDSQPCGKSFIADKLKCSKPVSAIPKRNQEIHARRSAAVSRLKAQSQAAGIKRPVNYTKGQIAAEVKAAVPAEGPAPAASRYPDRDMNDIGTAESDFLRKNKKIQALAEKRVSARRRGDKVAEVALAEELNTLGRKILDENDDARVRLGLKPLAGQKSNRSNAIAKQEQAVAAKVNALSPSARAKVGLNATPTPAPTEGTTASLTANKRYFAMSGKQLKDELRNRGETPYNNGKALDNRGMAQKLEALDKRREQGQERPAAKLASEVLKEAAAQAGTPAGAKSPIKITTASTAAETKNVEVARNVEKAAKELGVGPRNGSPSEGIVAEVELGGKVQKASFWMARNGTDRIPSRPQMTFIDPENPDRMLTASLTRGKYKSVANSAKRDLRMEFTNFSVRRAPDDDGLFSALGGSKGQGRDLYQEKEAGREGTAGAQSRFKRQAEDYKTSIKALQEDLNAAENPGRKAVIQRDINKIQGLLGDIQSKILPTPTPTPAAGTTPGAAPPNDRRSRRPERGSSQFHPTQKPHPFHESTRPKGKSSDDRKS
jgi:hypothetical protein